MKHESNSANALAKKLLQEGFFNSLDVHFAHWILKLSGLSDVGLFLASALASRAVALGHVCLDLREIGGKPLAQKPDSGLDFVCPEADSWAKSLLETRVVGNEHAFKPLILDASLRLYLHRYWHYENTLADHIKKRIQLPTPRDDMPLLLRNMMTTLFPESDGHAADQQAIAAYLSVTNSFCLISGGPGTGKTTTAAKIIAVVTAISEFRHPRILLAAPTGKAAARIKVAITRAKETLPVSSAVKSLIPDSAATLHRILGSIPGKTTFRFNEKNRLQADLVIVDEASMIDLPLMAKLIQAIPDQARIVLLGDSNQLSSVESGYILGDIYRREEHPGYIEDIAQKMEAALGLKKNSIPVRISTQKGLWDSIVTLDKNYRFSETGRIEQLSQAICRGDEDTVMNLLASGPYDDLLWLPETEGSGWAEKFIAAIREGFTPCLTARDPERALLELERFRVLCAVNHGPFGVLAINRQVERVFRKGGLIPSNVFRHESNYPGRPIVVTRNQYEVRLYNGDMGVVWSDSKKGLLAVFPALENDLRTVSIPMLGEHETAYAMTVHKSQGSEFNTVFLVLPDQPLPLLTRELLYTGITRARKNVILAGNEKVIRAAVSQKIQRRSGLKEALWGL